MGRQLTVHQQHIVALGFGSFYIAVLSLRVGGIEPDESVGTVSLRCLGKLLVFIEGEILFLHILQQIEFHGGVAELGVREHAVVDENLNTGPASLKSFAVIRLHFSQLLGNLL